MGLILPKGLKHQKRPKEIRTTLEMSDHELNELSDNLNEQVAVASDKKSLSRPEEKPPIKDASQPTKETGDKKSKKFAAKKRVQDTVPNDIEEATKPEDVPPINDPSLPKTNCAELSSEHDTSFSESDAVLGTQEGIIRPEEKPLFDSDSQTASVERGGLPQLIVLPQDPIEDDGLEDKTGSADNRNEQNLSVHFFNYVPWHERNDGSHYLYLVKMRATHKDIPEDDESFNKKSLMPMSWELRVKIMSVLKRENPEFNEAFGSYDGNKTLITLSLLEENIYKAAQYKIILKHVDRNVDKEKVLLSRVLSNLEVSKSEGTIIIGASLSYPPKEDSDEPAIAALVAGVKSNPPLYIVSLSIQEIDEETKQHSEAINELDVMTSELLKSYMNANQSFPKSIVYVRKGGLQNTPSGWMLKEVEKIKMGCQYCEDDYNPNFYYIICAKKNIVT